MPRKGFRKFQPPVSPEPASPPAPVRVLVVDDHPIVRRGLAELISREAGLTVCGSTGDPKEAQQLAAGQSPDVAIVDISLRGSCGLELIRDLKAAHPDLMILVISIHDEGMYAERALRAGARGYVMKHEATEVVARAIRRVHAGEIHLSDRMAARMLEKMTGNRPSAPNPLDPLSDRELEVFLLIGSGMGTRDIARLLHLSIKTVEAHRAHIKDKMGLRNATELVRNAVRWVELDGVATARS